MLAPRLRIFAGPNGSGKSTIKELLPSEWLGIYINADDIEKTVRENGYLELSTFKIEATTGELQDSRVKHRVETGGHDVPHDKIVNRYARSLGLLSDALTYTNRAYIFDNSGHAKVWIAEVTDGDTLEIKTDQMPAWFKTALWDKFDAPD